MSEYLKCENCGVVIELSDDASDLVNTLYFDVGVRKAPATIVEEVVKSVFEPCCENPSYSFLTTSCFRINRLNVLEYVWSENRSEEAEKQDGGS